VGQWRVSLRRLRADARLEHENVLRPVVRVFRLHAAHREREPTQASTTQPGSADLLDVLLRELLAGEVTDRPTAEIFHTRDSTEVADHFEYVAHRIAVEP